MVETYDDFKPRNGWAIFAMIVFAVAFFAFLVSIFIYETQRDKPKPWWCWIGFIISIVLLVVAFAAFAFINIGGTSGYHHRMRYAPDWESRKVEVIDPSHVVNVQTQPVSTYMQPIPVQGNISPYVAQTPSVAIAPTPYMLAPGYTLNAPTQSLL